MQLIFNSINQHALLYLLLYFSSLKALKFKIDILYLEKTKKYFCICLLSKQIQCSNLSVIEIELQCHMCFFYLWNAASLMF